ncbi:MAG: AAA family ATPase [bacterium]|nr:AAA family ATPase [bacterium]
MIYRFLDFELDDSELRIRRDGNVVAVEPRVLALIIRLVEQRDRIVARDELLERVWEGGHVSDHVLSQALYAARRVLGDTAKEPRLIETVRGRGVKFIAPVSLDAAAAAQGSPFVGRAGEMETLLSLLHEAREGRPKFALIRGEPGAGKTRLWSEFATSARERGHSVVVGRCSEEPGAPALWPWIQMARGLRDFATVLGETQLSEAAEAWLHRPGQPSGSARGIEPTHFGAMDMTSELWREAAARIPIVLVIDDLHRADDASFRQLVFLCEEMRPCPIFVLAAYRTSEVEWPPERLEALRCLERQAEIIDAAPLDARAARTLADEMSGELDVARFDRIYQLSGGNPLFLTQLLSQPASSENPELPTSAVVAAEARVDLLPERCQQTLAVASVFGREFSIAQVSSVLDRSESETLEDLGLAEDASLVHSRNSAGGYARFSHALVRDAIYGRLGPSRKTEFHYLVAKTLEEFGVGEKQSSELAYHYVEAISLSGAEPGTEYSAFAGHEALSRGAFSEAAFHCRRALSLIREHDVCRNLEPRAAIDLAAALKAMGQKEEARTNILEAMTIAEQAGDWRIGCEASLMVASGVASIEAGRVDEVAVSVIRRSLTHVPADAHAERSRLLARLAMTLYWEPGSLSEREELLEAAEQAAQGAGDRSSRLFVDLFRVAALWQPRDVRTRLNAVSGLAAAAADAGDAQIETVARIFRISTLAELGQRAQREREIARLETLVQKPGAPESRWYPALYKASLALDEGNWLEMERMTKEMARLGEPYDDANLTQSCEGLGVLKAFHFGQFRDVLPGMSRMLEDFPAFAIWRAGRALFAERAGETSLAMLDYRAMGAAVADHAEDNVWLCVLTYIAEASLGLGIKEDGPRFRERLQPYLGQRPTAGYGVFTWGIVGRVVGRLYSSEGEYMAAITCLEEAAEADSRASCIVWRAYTLTDLARARLETGLRTEISQAKAELREAGEIASSLGLVAVSKSVLEIGGGLPG